VGPIIPIGKMAGSTTIPSTALLAGACIFSIILAQAGLNAFVVMQKEPFSFNRAPQGVAVLSSYGADAATKSARGVAQDIGVKGLLGFGMGFGVLAAIVRQSGRVSRHAAGSDIAVAEKTETQPVAYLENIPRSIMEKETLDKLLSTLPREQWENPPEDSYLYTLKMFAETYGEGKATKMGWWDYWYMRVNMPDADEFYSGEEMEAEYNAFKDMSRTGAVPLFLPGPASFFPTGATVQWRGPEPFAGDQVQSPVTDSLAAKQYINNMAFYREGLKPWQRGLEIGLAHGYFLVGPFTALGPLRNTPEAATVGLLAGIAVVGIVSVGGLIFGQTIKPTRFDKEGDKPAVGFNEMIQWHAAGGIGGAAFAHILLTLFRG